MKILLLVVTQKIAERISLERETMLHISGFYLKIMLT